jgi:myo-inositol 2-dehydrogenase / D-chiro-inositol 1-dehydrogenase
MSNKIRIGILSFAHYHANFWAQALLKSADAELAGIWDDDPQRGKKAAEQYSVPFYSDLSQLLQKSDGVGITSETSRHADLVEEAARAGVHILLEKPMAAGMEQCARIYQAVKSAGILFMQNFPKRYDPVNHELVRMVRSGELGKLHLVRIRHGNYHLLELGESASAMWYGKPELSGGGALIDEGVHAADLLLWLLGEPTLVSALTSNRTLGLPLEDTALAIFAYPSGVLAEIATSNTLVAAEESVEVYGTEGSAIISGVDLASRDLSRPPYLKYYRIGSSRESWQASPVVPRFQQGEFHHQGPLHFIECLAGRAEPIVSLEDGWKSLAMIEAAYQAARTGQVQQLDFSAGPTPLAGLGRK